MPIVEICTENESYGFATNNVSKPAEATNLEIRVEYEGNCSGSSGQGCLLPRFISSDSQPSQIETDQSAYTLIGPIQNGQTVNFMASGEYIYFSFFGSSSCLNITRLIVTYSRCPAVTSSLATYPASFSGSSVTGNCVPNAEIGAAPQATCEINGTFSFSSSGCQCRPGYTLAGEQCECKCISHCYVQCSIGISWHSSNTFHIFSIRTPGLYLFQPFKIAGLIRGQVEFEGDFY